MSRSKHPDDGPYLGLFLEGKRTRGQVRYNGPKHLLSMGPPGTGKSTGLAIPNIAHLARSLFIVDIKGEIAAVTARKRAKMGRVLTFNPFGVLVHDLPHLKSHGYNPPATFDPRSDDFVSRSDTIAEALIPITNEYQSFFPKAARNLVSANIMWECMQNGPKANLANVRRALTAPTSYDENKKPDGGFLKNILDMASCPYYPIANRIGEIAERLSDRNAATGSVRDVISSAAEGMKFLDDPCITRDLQGPGFDFADMRKEIITVYLILPARELATQALWLRMVLNCALRALYEPPKLNEEPGLPPVLFILDEFFAIGKLDMIEGALAYARGHRLQLWPFIQDLNQIESLYPKTWQSFLSSAGAVTAFAPKDWFTAEYLAKLGGQRTEDVETRHEGSDGSGGRNWGPQGFPLLRPEDLMRMPPEQMLCFVEPEPFPFFTVTQPYPRTPFNAGLDPNPYYRGR
jgi:type IV secretion system protein VirD4